MVKFNITDNAKEYINSKGGQIHMVCTRIGGG